MIVPLKEGYELRRSPIDVTPAVGNSLTVALQMDSSAVPSIPETWGGKTLSLLETRWKGLSPLAKRASVFFTNLGHSFPDCSTLESITRQIVRVRDFVPEDAVRILGRFQKRSMRLGSEQLLTLSASALVPLMGNLPSDETDAFKALIALVPTALVLTKRGESGGLKYEDELLLNDTMRPDYPSVIAAMREEYRGKRKAQRQIDVYDGESDYHKELEKYKKALKADDEEEQRRLEERFRKNYPDAKM